MARKKERLSALSKDDLNRLRKETGEWAGLQEILNCLPMGLQVEALSEDALTRLREVASSPEELLAGPNLLLWNNVCRLHIGLARTS